MFSFVLSDQPISKEEQAVFGIFLKHKHLDKNIWPIFNQLLLSEAPHTKALALRVYEDKLLVGVVILLKCTRYGKALFHNYYLQNLTNTVGFPFILWVRLGCCMDMMSNPGFVRNPEREDEIISAIVKFLERRFRLTIINDIDQCSFLYPNAAILPALPHALIDVTELSSIADYQRGYKNLKRKQKVFSRKGGLYRQYFEIIDDSFISDLKSCFLSTAENSSMYLPYQDLYLNAALNISSTRHAEVIYFTAFLRENFIGYQAALKTGTHLNALHGAFDRNRKSNNHAYDLLFLKMTDYAIKENLSLLDFGAIINHTKARMVNTTHPTNYYVLSNLPILRNLFSRFLSHTRIQSHEQLQFR